MKILQLGSGSMGTRRLRDLHRRGGLSLALFDEREDRRDRAERRFGVKTFRAFEDALAWSPDALVISTPPGAKSPYIQAALDLGLHHFSEADIWTYGAAEIERVSQEKGLVCACSTSMMFLPIMKELARLARESLGSLLNYQACMATYQPIWHPGEGSEYYARHRSTCPSREMIVFELLWLNSLFSPAAEIAGRYEKYGALPDAIEDTWSLSMRLRDGGAGQLTLTMASPVWYRRGACFGTNGILTWDIYGGIVTAQTARDKGPRVTEHGAMDDVLEQAYYEEIGAFVDACEGRGKWPQPCGVSQLASATLAAAERSHQSGKWIPLDPAAEPERELARVAR